MLCWGAFLVECTRASENVSVNVYIPITLEKLNITDYLYAGYNFVGERLEIWCTTIFIWFMLGDYLYIIICY
jgi:hypothetical protein